MSKIVKSLYRRPNQGLISGDEQGSITDVRNFRLLDGAWQRTEGFFAFYEDGKETKHVSNTPQISRIEVRDSVVSVELSEGSYQSIDFRCVAFNSDGLRLASVSFIERKAVFYPVDLGTENYGGPAEFVVTRVVDEVVVSKMQYYLPEILFVPVPTWERDGSVLQVTPVFDYDFISILFWNGTGFYEVASFQNPAVDVAFTFDLSEVNLPFVSWRIQGTKIGIKSYIDSFLADSLITGEDNLILAEPSGSLSDEFTVTNKNGLFVENKSNQVQWFRIWSFSFGGVVLSDADANYTEQAVAPGQMISLTVNDPGDCFKYMSVLKSPYDGSNMTVGVPSDLYYNERTVADLPESVTLSDLSINTNGGNFEVMLIGSGMSGNLIWSDSNEHVSAYDLQAVVSPEVGIVAIPNSEVELEDYTVNLWYEEDGVYYIIARYWKNTGWENYVNG